MEYSKEEYKAMVNMLFLAPVTGTSMADLNDIYIKLLVFIDTVFENENLD